MHVVIKSYTTHPQNEEKTEKDYKKTYVYCVNVQVFWINLSGSYLRLTPSLCTGLIENYKHKKENNQIEKGNKE